MSLRLAEDVTRSRPAVSCINRNTYSEAKKKRGNSDDSQRIATHINA